MAVDVEIPGMGESVTEAVLVEWLKEEGAFVERDEPLCVLETDKANVDLPAPASGVLHHLRQVDEAVAVGDVIARVDESAARPAGGSAAQGPAAAGEPAGLAETDGQGAAQAGQPEVDAAQASGPAVRRLLAEEGVDAASVQGTGRGGRLTKGDVLAHLQAPRQKPPRRPREDKPRRREGAAAPAAASQPAAAGAQDGTRRVPMSRIRQRIAEHLVAAQHNAAMLTTFNEVDMSAVTDLRARHKERFSEVHGVSLGLMSFFARAVVVALREFPAVNAFVEGEEIVYHDYVHLGIAVSTDRGLVVPVLRRADLMSMARIEAEIKRLAQGARDNKLSMDDLSGGTFTITNGGVFGSLLSTPILNAPQSAILGMHAIQKRPVAVDDQVHVRPMMYLALSYDHRLIDGQTSVTFLVRIRQLVEDPARLMLEV